MSGQEGIRAAEDIIRMMMHLKLDMNVYEHKVKVMNNIRDDLLIDVKIYDKLQQKRPDLLQNLVIWCRNTKIVERKHSLKIKYPVIDGMIMDDTITYSLNLKEVGNFWFHRLYTEDPDF